MLEHVTRDLSADQTGRVGVLISTCFLIATCWGVGQPKSLRGRLNLCNLCTGLAMAVGGWLNCAMLLRGHAYQPMPHVLYLPSVFAAIATISPETGAVVGAAYSVLATADSIVRPVWAMEAHLNNTIITVSDVHVVLLLWTLGGSMLLRVCATQPGEGPSKVPAFPAYITP